MLGSHGGTVCDLPGMEVTDQLQQLGLSQLRTSPRQDGKEEGERKAEPGWTGGCGSSQSLLALSGVVSSSYAICPSCMASGLPEVRASSRTVPSSVGGGALLPSLPSAPSETNSEKPLDG